jgi:hypothetical protein
MVVHESMIAMKDEKEKKLQVLQQSGQLDDPGMQLMTFDFYRKMVHKQDKAMVGLLAQQEEQLERLRMTKKKVGFLHMQIQALTRQLLHLKKGEEGRICLTLLCVNVSICITSGVPPFGSNFLVPVRKNYVKVFIQNG